jgi:hypothetical protein
LTFGLLRVKAPRLETRDMARFGLVPVIEAVTLAACAVASSKSTKKAR